MNRDLATLILGATKFTPDSVMPSMFCGEAFWGILKKFCDQVARRVSIPLLNFEP
jgi:hypothetical protein